MLGRSDYVIAWRGHHAGSVPPGEPVPDALRSVPGVHGAPAPDATAQAELFARWERAPASHVLDCGLDLGGEVLPYAIYVPRDYLEHPERPRPVLVLLPGGHGDRSRWFLTPLPTPSMIPGTGGLEIRRRVDAWSAAHPTAAPPLVVGLDRHEPRGGLGAFVVGALRRHLLEVWLPGQREATTAWGVASISSGCVTILRVLHGHPDAFDYSEFLSPYVHPRGFRLAELGHGPTRDAWLREAARLHREGRAHWHFSVGEADDHFPRVQALHRVLVDGGVFPRVSAPSREDCARGRHGRLTCVHASPGLRSVPRTGHSYLALLPTFPWSLNWLLAGLSGSQERRAQAPR